MNTKYHPVDPDYFDMIEAEMEKNKFSTVDFFGEDDQLSRAKGVPDRIDTNSRNEDHLLLKSGRKIRLDRIIALNGKPGPAYDEYDSYANACLDCMGGMED